MSVASTVELPLSKRGQERYKRCEMKGLFVSRGLTIRSTLWDFAGADMWDVVRG